MKLLKSPKFHLIFLTILMLLCFLFWQPLQMDDGSNYQRFVETLVDQKKIDLSIPGFHGADFFAALVYIITGSHFSVYIFDILCALLIIWMIYLVAKELYDKKVLAIMASYLYVLMPFTYFNAFRGGHNTVLLLSVLIALYLLLKNKNWSWLPLGISYIIRPLAFVVLPLYIYKKQFKQFLASLTIPALYVVAQYSQLGKIIIGQHTDVSVQTALSIKTFFINLVYGVQWYFSIHNYSPVSQSYLMDLAHLSPLITILAVLGVLYYKKYSEFLEDKKKFISLTCFAILAYLLPCAIFYFQPFYFTIFNLALILLALPVIYKYQRLIPILVGSFAFQFYYYYLSYYELWIWPKIVFILPIIIFIISLIYIRWSEKGNSMQEIKQQKLGELLKFISQEKRVTNDEVQDLLNVSDATATRYLDELERQEKIKQVGETGKGVYYIIN